MYRKLKSAALIGILAFLYGCDTNWTPSGSAKSVIGFGHPDGSKQDTHPMEEAVYGAGSNILIEYHSAATFGGDADAESVSHLARRGIIRDRDSGKVWNGSEWIQDDSGSLCELPVSACVEVESGDLTYCLDTDSLSADALGNCNCEIEISACNTGTIFGDPEGTIASTTRSFTINLEHPVTEITAPSKDSMADAPVTIHGTAARGSSAVEIIITDRESGQVWDPESGFRNATGDDGISIDVGPTDTTWQYAFDDSAAQGSGNYRISAVARALDGSSDKSPAVIDFSISGNLPEVEILQPADRYVYSSEELPVEIRGRASNQGIVAGVEIRISDFNTGQVWNESTATLEQPDYSNPEQGWISLEPGTPAETFNWAYQWHGIESGTGQYVIAVRASNAVGQTTLAPWPTVQFFGPNDNQPAATTITLPRPGQVLDRVEQLAGGVATDAHSGVTRVAVEILERGETERYWGVLGARTGWYGIPIAGPIPTFDAELEPVADSDAVNWTARFWDAQDARNKGGNGKYRMRVLVYDGQGNEHQSPYVDFSVDNSAVPDS